MRGLSRAPTQTGLSNISGSIAVKDVRKSPFKCIFFLDFIRNYNLK